MSVTQTPGSTAEVARVLRDGGRVLPVGAGSKAGWGPRAEYDTLLGLGRMDRLIEHAAGDLVVKVQAGMAVRALNEVLARAGQELAVDVVVPGTTVGGLLATAMAGPRRFRYGTPRDLLIGVTIVLADGTVAKSGGRVVKNVAGYDLGKLFTGSWGSLGVITDATFRLHPLPADRRWVTGRAGADVAAELTASQIEPSAVEINTNGTDTEISALVEGVAALDRAVELRELIPGAEVTRTPPPWWGSVPEGAVLIETRVLPSRLGELPKATIRGSAATGVLFAALPREDALHTLMKLREIGRATVRRAPHDLDADWWGPIGGLPLMRRIKERFDPEGRMSPGRFLGGL